MCATSHSRFTSFQLLSRRLANLRADRPKRRRGKAKFWVVGKSSDDAARPDRSPQVAARPRLASVTRPPRRGSIAAPLEGRGRARHIDLLRHYLLGNRGS
ncbi:hypothetical protein RRG08_044068 [Elysia crispata]|uniref:Uncharacterized protein n=1 Tax=Elysia crispata TaxID=231223 RepID=A0AAE0Y1S2_9GAST|nr:hypothetical protein RRG08_044068 [Elysia crispata]